MCGRKYLFCILVTVTFRGLVEKAATATSYAFFRELRVVGGFDINITKIPYQLAMEYSGTPFCSGTIISEYFVITASHCLERFDPDDVTVRVGTSKRASGGDVLKIRNITKNPKFSLSQLDYDVAVVELDAPITFDSFRGPVELASEEPVAGENLTVSGWGRTAERGSVATNLQSTKVKIIDRDLCKRSYKSKVNITERMFCAGGIGQDSCGGDSGAPATRDGKLVGIVSWGFGCARQTYPGVYANLLNSEMRQFIKDVSGV